MELEYRYRPTWDEYFLSLAKLASTRSTCLSNVVGAVIVKGRRVLATGYNGSTTGSPHCIDQGFCYPGVLSCSASDLPSRSTHAEINAIAQAAKEGINVNKGSIYVTRQPCLSCLKAIAAAGIKEVCYEHPHDKSSTLVYDTLLKESGVCLREISLSSRAQQLFSEIWQ